MSQTKTVQKKAQHAVLLLCCWMAAIKDTCSLIGLLGVSSLTCKPQILGALVQAAQT